jgi:hypothetical protein
MPCPFNEDDFFVVDGGTKVTFRQQTAVGEFNETIDVNAIKRMPSRRSVNEWTAGIACVWHLYAPDLENVEPRPGDQIVEASGKTWVISGLVDLQQDGGRWRCECAKGV